jgi:hypothetical protein
VETALIEIRMLILMYKTDVLLYGEIDIKMSMKFAAVSFTFVNTYMYITNVKRVAPTTTIEVQTQIKRQKQEIVIYALTHQSTSVWLQICIFSLV